MDTMPPGFRYRRIRATNLIELTIIQPIDNADSFSDSMTPVGWADGFIVCPRGLASAWAQKRAHLTFFDFKHNFFENKLALGLGFFPLGTLKSGVLT